MKRPSRLAPRVVAALLAAAGGAAANSPAPPRPAGAEPPTHRLTVSISGLRSPNGQVIVCLWAQPGTFPDCNASAPFRRAAAGAGAPETSVAFDSVPRGTYAVSVLHDEDGDGRTRTNFLGIPSEGVGVSNNVRRMMGAPSFAEAGFSVEGNTAITVTIRY